MRHEHLTRTVGQQIVGKQNILPALRDAAEDERRITVTMDAERQRHTGVLLEIEPGFPERVSYRPEGVVASAAHVVETAKVLSFRIDNIDES